MTSFYKKGSYNVICDYSGIEVKAEDTRMTWDGFRVKNDWWEERHPQDFVAVLRDKQSVPNPRPEPDESYAMPFLAFDLLSDDGIQLVTDMNGILTTDVASFI